jgi:hypothetical protein
MNETTTPANQAAPPKPESEATLAAPAGSASEAIVYAGKHYGRKHRILFDTGNLVTLIHEPSGDTLTVHGCDVERETPNDQAHPTAAGGTGGAQKGL